jgi:hypothetical protein
MLTTPVNASFKAPGPANIKQQIKPRPLGQTSQILFEIADLSPLSPDLQSSKKKNTDSLKKAKKHKKEL